MQSKHGPGLSYPVPRPLIKLTDTVLISCRNRIIKGILTSHTNLDTYSIEHINSVALNHIIVAVDSTCPHSLQAHKMITSLAFVHTEPILEQTKTLMEGSGMSTTVQNEKVFLNAFILSSLYWQQ